MLEARLALGLRAIQLHHERRARVHRVAGAGGALGGADREVVHHLDRAGHDPLRHDSCDHLAGLDGGAEEGHERANSLGLRHHAQPDPGRDAERALRADEGAEQVITRVVELGAAERDLGPVGQHQLEAGYVVRGEAVLEAMRAA